MFEFGTALLMVGAMVAVLVVGETLLVYAERRPARRSQPQ